MASKYFNKYNIFKRTAEAKGIRYYNRTYINSNNSIVLRGKTLRGKLISRPTLKISLKNVLSLTLILSTLNNLRALYNLNLNNLGSLRKLYNNKLITK